MISITGRARVFGDDVNTDHIVSSSRKKESIDPSRLAPYLFEALDPGFAASLEEGDVIVAGRNFGCGSAMEVAVTTLVHAGVRAVLAESFARTYYRNALNNGLVPVRCDTGEVREGDRIDITIGEDGIRIHNETRGSTAEAVALSPFALELLEAGGIVPLIAERGGFPEVKRTES